MSDTEVKTVYDEIKDERNYQDNKWGVTADDTRNTPFHWVNYIGKYSTKWLDGSWEPFQADTVENFRTAMIKTAAIAVAAVESIDRQRKGADARPFYQA